jgi:dTMP kinase
MSCIRANPVAHLKPKPCGHYWSRAKSDAGRRKPIIRPALAKKHIVICDRFMDSTRAYQGYAGHCDMTLLDALEKTIVGHTRPNLTLIFDLDPIEGLARAKARSDGTEDRYERKGLAFHQKLREGFLAIAKAEPARCKIINATGSIDDVAALVKAAAGSLLDG